MKKILAADDDPNMTAFYKALFTDAGYEVETASDGVAVMEKYLEFHPDLLVLDVGMPCGGGKRIFNLLRNYLKLGIPVIFVTGTPEKVRATAAKFAKVSVMTKPVISENLLAEARRLLGL